MSLPSDLRLTRTADFAAVRESGRSWNGRFLIIAVRPRPDRGRAHFGFTTTRRIGNAVKRNLVRRRLRMIAREHSPLIKLTHDVVTIARHSAVKAEFEALRQDWIRLATRAGLLKPETKPRHEVELGGMHSSLPSSAANAEKSAKAESPPAAGPASPDPAGGV